MKWEVAYAALMSFVVLQTLVFPAWCLTDQAFARDALAEFGDLLCAGIDARGGEVAVAGWREGSGVAADELVQTMGSWGFKHLVYTDIARDGMQTGIDPDAYVAMAQAFGNPVTASGGVALADIEALSCVADSIEGIITGRAVYEGTLDVAEAIALCKRATEAAC